MTTKLTSRTVPSETDRSIIMEEKSHFFSDLTLSRGQNREAEANSRFMEIGLECRIPRFTELKVVQQVTNMWQVSKPALALLEQCNFQCRTCLRHSLKLLAYRQRPDRVVRCEQPRIFSV